MIIKNKFISLLEYEESKEKLLEKELRELELINKSLNTPIFQITAKGTFKASKYVGVIQVGNKTIEILPKILGKNKSEIKKNLLFMLSYTKKLKLKETDISTLSKNSTLYEIIIYLFAKNLIELLKKDLVKNYETKEENNNFLKGKLLMSKHLKYNLFNKTKIYSEFDEFTENNLLNQIFKATINKLLKSTSNNINFRLLTESNLILEDVSLNNISYEEAQKVKFNRLNQQYEDIFNLAKILLFGNSIELNAKDTKTYSLMFDMNKLFEEFIFEFIKKNCNYNNFLIRTELPRKYLFKEAPRFQLKPDITFYTKDEKECKLILDTKYKIITEFKTEENNENKIRNGGISTQDIYQMFVYSQIYQCNKIILLYPEYEIKVNEKLIFDNKNDKLNDFQIKIKTINLHKDLTIEKETLKNELDKILNII